MIVLLLWLIVSCTHVQGRLEFNNDNLSPSLSRASGSFINSISSRGQVSVFVFIVLNHSKFIYYIIIIK